MDDREQSQSQQGLCSKPKPVFDDMWSHASHPTSRARSHHQMCMISGRYSCNQIILLITILSDWWCDWLYDLLMNRTTNHNTKWLRVRLVVQSPDTESYDYSRSVTTGCMTLQSMLPPALGLSMYKNSILYTGEYPLPFYFRPRHWANLRLGKLNSFKMTLANWI